MDLEVMPFGAITLRFLLCLRKKFLCEFFGKLEIKVEGGAGL